jgi:hypothetical protein
LFQGEQALVFFDGRTGSPLDHGQGEEQDAAKAEFAVDGGVPLSLGVSSAAIAAGAERNGGNAKGER